LTQITQKYWSAQKSCTYPLLYRPYCLQEGKTRITETLRIYIREISLQVSYSFQDRATQFFINTSRHVQI